MKKLTVVTVSPLINVVGLLSRKKERGTAATNNHPPLVTEILMLWLIIILLFTSCKKELPGEEASSKKDSFIAVAGPDQVITLPTDSVLLDGGKSSDPDRKISEWQWTKISGPDSITIVNSTAAQTWVTHLEEGYYLIELKATDLAGLSAKDTVHVTVLSTQQICDTLNRATITIQLVPVAAIPTPRYSVTATAGNKLLLAGGYTDPGGTRTPVSDVDIYDFGTQTWSTAHLSTAREDMTAATIGNKIFFLAGYVSGTDMSATTRVDIYDASTNAWSFSDLPSALSFVYSYAGVGNKVFFVTDRAPVGKVDVYDTSTGLWSEIDLPEHQVAPTATTVGDKVYFAGGLTNVVDIYDNVTGTWSTTSPLSLPTWAIGSIYVNGKIYWAGGIIGHDAALDRVITTCKVEIRDVSTGSSSFTSLSAPNGFEGNYSKPIYYKNKIIFQGYNYFDIYDPQSSTWSIGQFPQNVSIGPLILVNNALYAIGCNDCSSDPLPNQIWKLQY